LTTAVSWTWMWPGCRMRGQNRVNWVTKSLGYGIPWMFNGSSIHDDGKFAPPVLFIFKPIPLLSQPSLSNLISWWRFQLAHIFQDRHIISAI
jgi:hypothetical protein